jgi:hypothetical protein
MLRDVLDDLRHDLGKYLAMPLRMLPADASQAELRKALEEALHRTRRSPRGNQPAREIYAEARAELVKARANAQRLAALDAAVAMALDWERVLRNEDAELERAAVERDLLRVRELLEDWLDEVSR